MKNLPIILALFLTIGMKAQTSIEFKYDAAGNRTSRKVITLNPQKKGDVVEDKEAGINFTLTPNPTAGKITLSTDEAFGEKEEKKVFVYDLSGNVVYSKELVEGEIEIDLSRFPQGAYIIKLTAKDFANDWKVVKM